MEKTRSVPELAGKSAPELTTRRCCDCAHETMTDGVHHYLDLPGESDGVDGRPLALDGSLESQEGVYIAVAYSDPDLCFLSPTWAATFRGPSEAGEIPPSLRLLCDWCKKHWSQAPAATFRRI